MPRHSSKNGPRKPYAPGYATHTEQRLAARDTWWEPIKKRLRRHFDIPGAKHRMAQVTGIADSQLHCFTCPDCEHNQEPCFSVGMVIVQYLIREEYKARCITLPLSRTPSHYRTAGCLALLQAVRTDTRPAGIYTSPNRYGTEPHRATVEDHHLLKK